MPLEAGSWACTVTLSVTSITIRLPSDRQAADKDACAGFHLRSCTQVPASTAGRKDVNGNFCCLAWWWCRNKNGQRKDVIFINLFFFKINA